MQILVVDDDPLAGEMAVAILEEAGHECQWVENGVEALEKLAEAPIFDLVISDMNMPLLSGLDLFWELRSQGLTLPFVLLTGDEPASLLAQEPGLAGCLMKDASLEDALPMLVNRL
ncbi:MAG TPA: response regulator [Gammaproteobacteria bacterium]|nr:response regulator [Gammaproteobacteria bacterium]